VTFDEDRAADLLSPLLDAEPAPPRVDLREAIGTARRRRRRRRIASASSVIAAVAVVAAAVPLGINAVRTDVAVQAGTGVAASPTRSAPIVAPVVPVPRSCKGATLPIPDNVAEALVTAADPTGTAIFGRSYPKGSDSRQVLLWKNGKVTKIDFPGIDQRITSVSPSAGDGGVVAVGSGVTVGSAENEATAPRAYLYRDGAVTLLPDGKGAQAYGINASSVIVGEKADRPVIWPSPTSKPVELTLPSGFSNGYAVAIDDDGTVVGNIRTTIGSRTSVGFVWAPDGTGRVLPPPAGAQGQGDYAANAVRNGWVTGIDNSTSPAQGLRWNLRSGSVEAVPDFIPNTTNASGWMVGTDPQGRGLLRADDRKVTLPDIFGHGSDPYANLPVTISDDGRTIAGQADDAAGTIHAAIWSCS
jgi:hypothetical protein